jgi:hypothetical protein
MDEKWTWRDYVDGGPNLDQRLIKIAKLLKRMRAWENKNGDTPMDSPNGVMFGKDMDYVNKVKSGLSGMLNNYFQFNKETKTILNKIWKRYA